MEKVEGLEEKSLEKVVSITMEEWIANPDKYTADDLIYIDDRAYSTMWDMWFDEFDDCEPDEFKENEEEDG